MPRRQIRNIIYREFTPEELARWKQAVAEEEAGREENIREGLRLKAVTEEQSVSGELRRAMREGDLEYDQLAAGAGISEETLTEFMRGEQTLPLNVVDRLAGQLGLHLTQSAAATR